MPELGIDFEGINRFASRNDFCSERPNSSERNHAALAPTALALISLDKYAIAED
jgi:hypothetical protein